MPSRRLPAPIHTDSLIEIQSNLLWRNAPCLHYSLHWLCFSSSPTLCDHDATARPLTHVHVPLEIRPKSPSKPMIQHPWFVVHYTLLLPDNLLDTTMTALRVLITFVIIIHELISNQQKVGHTCTLRYMQCLSNHYLWVPCDVFVGRPNTQLPVECLFPLICTDA